MRWDIHPSSERRHNASICKLALAREFRVFDVSTLAADTLKNEYNPFSVTPFGADLSLDGVHPSSVGYGKIARELGKFINKESKFPFLQTEFQSQKQALEIEPSSACFFYENILLKVG